MQLITEREAADMLNCTASALRRMRRERRSPAYARIGKLIRYKPQDVEDFVRRHTHNSDQQ
jgi:excisionase family DNA binding protein